MCQYYQAVIRDEGLMVGQCRPVQAYVVLDGGSW